MYAALAIADEELVQRMLQEAFAGQNEEAKAKVWSVIRTCKEMLEKEPPEKMTSYWTDVSELGCDPDQRRTDNSATAGK
ncbi:hypothetical protein PC116_g29871 [Phytophthora cactorum]|nr:hypothetical protein PC116_g29871 [Phytophthora cactorum]